jgi:putative transposase
VSTPKRLPAECYQGFARLFLTICVDSRRREFTTAKAFDCACAALLRTARDYDVEGTVYVFMPDHVHGLFEATREDADLKKFADMFKQRSGFAHKQATRRTLWQKGYFDRLLRDDDDSLDVIAYIIANPVRAGLCDDPKNYPYLGSTKYSIDQLLDAVGSRPDTWRPE